MREKLFKSKSFDGEWVYGDLIQSRHESAFILPIEEEKLTNVIEVYPETVLQFVGLYDKNGVKIFEKDIIQLAKRDYLCYIEWKQETTQFVCIALRDKANIGKGLMQLVYTIGYTHNGEKCEVLGNMIDNSDIFYKQSL